MSDERFSGIEKKLDALVSGQARIETRLGKLEVGHDEMKDNVMQIAEGHAATQAAIERAVQTVCTYIDQRITPLEDAVREHLGTS